MRCVCAGNNHGEAGRGAERFGAGWFASCVIYGDGRETFGQILYIVCGEC